MNLQSIILLGILLLLALRAVISFFGKGGGGRCHGGCRGCSNGCPLSQ